MSLPPASALADSYGLLPAPQPPAGTIINSPFTGDYRIDVLLDSLDYRWNMGSPLGTPVEVTYSFMLAAPEYGGTNDGDGDTGFQVFTAAEQQAVRDIFARLQAETGLSFRAVDESVGGYGQIRFGNNFQKVSAGYAYLPNSTGSELDGDVWIDASYASALANVVPGTDVYATLVHEIGHALGLKHPGNYNAGESPTPGQGNYLGTAEDNTLYSILSYTDPPNGLVRNWYGIYDLLALRALYGSGPEFGGNDRHAYTDSQARSMSTLYDSGGIDTLDLSGTTGATTVDLRPGGFSSFGRGFFGPYDNNLSIDLSTLIENFVGGSASDTVVGNSANNRLTLGAGTNWADGADGQDFAVYSSPRAGFSVAASGGTISVNGGTTHDTLVNIERLQFSDRGLAFDPAAQSTAKLLGAVFGPDAVKNTGYAGIGIAQVDQGKGYAALAQLALDARLGPQPSNEAVVNLLYTNVVGQAPGAADLAFFKGLLDTGEMGQVSLAIMAADHEMNLARIDLTGIIAHGLAYT